MSRLHRTPQYLLSRQQAMARLIASRIKQEPGRCLAMTKRHLVRWKSTLDPPTRGSMQAWIDASNNADQVIEILLRKGEQADLLRSVAPLTGFLPQEERLAFLNTYTGEYREPGTA